MLKWGLPGGGVKSAKVAPTPYVYYPPEGSGRESCISVSGAWRWRALPRALSVRPLSTTPYRVFRRSPLFGAVACSQLLTVVLLTYARTIHAEVDEGDVKAKHTLGC